MTELRGRFAPSPTGELHLGNASSALVAWLSIRSRGGSFVMRVEDLDRARSRPELAVRMFADLDWLGLDWDEGPDRGGRFAPYGQAERLEFHREAFRSLQRAGRLYPCFCSRKDIAAAASAPQSPGEERSYPGNCLRLDPETAASRVRAGERHAWRFRMDANARPTFVDLAHGPFGADGAPPGDFVVWRSDEVPAYQLAVVVDDAAMEITEVVRGDDLLPSTIRQLVLYEALGLAAPRFGHAPLLLGPDGTRLSKRHRGITLRELRESGFTAQQIVGRLAHLLGLRPTDEPLPARSLVRAFEWSHVRRSGDGIVVDPASWSGGP